jgi:hypothetical protein
MKQRKLGRGGPIVSAIGLGCMEMLDFYGKRDDKEFIATIRRALDRRSCPSRSRRTCALPGLGDGNGEPVRGTTRSQNSNATMPIRLNASGGTYSDYQ